MPVATHFPVKVIDFRFKYFRLNYRSRYSRLSLLRQILAPSRQLSATQWGVIFASPHSHQRLTSFSAISSGLMKELPIFGYGYSSMVRNVKGLTGLEKLRDHFFVFRCQL